MKLRLIHLVVALLCLPVFASGQATSGFHRISQILQRTPQGGVNAQVVPFATVALTNTATGQTAVVFSDPGLSLRITGGVLKADQNGNYDYYFALNYCVTETISWPGAGSIVLPNICSNGGTSGGGSPGNPLLSFQFNNSGTFGGSPNVGTDAATKTDLIFQSNGSNAFILNGSQYGSTYITQSNTGGITTFGSAQNTISVPGNFTSPTSGGWRPALTGVIEDRNYGLAVYVRPEYFCLLQGTPQSCANGLYDEAAMENQAMTYMADNQVSGYGKVMLLTNIPQGRNLITTNYLVNRPVNGPDYHGFGGSTTTASVGFTVTNKQIASCTATGGSGYAPSANLPVQIFDTQYKGTGATATVQTDSTGTPNGCTVGLQGMNYSNSPRGTVIAIGGDGATATIPLTGGVFTVNAANATTTAGSGYASGTPVGAPIGTGLLQCTTYPTFTAIASGNLTGTGISTFANSTAGVACTFNGNSTASVPVYFGNSCNGGQCTLAATQTPVQQPCAVAVRAGVRIQGVGMPYIATPDVGIGPFGTNGLDAYCDPFGDQTNNNNVVAVNGSNAPANPVAGPVVIDGINLNALIGFDFAGPLTGVTISNNRFNGGVFMMAPAAFENSIVGSNYITNNIVQSDGGVVCGGYWNTRDPVTQASGSLGGLFWLNKTVLAGTFVYSPYGAAAGIGFQQPALAPSIQYSYCSGMKYEKNSWNGKVTPFTTVVGGSGMTLSTTASGGVLTGTPTIVTAGTNYYNGSVARIGVTDATVIVTASTGGVPSAIAIQNPGTTATTSGSATTSTSYPSVDLFFQHNIWQTQHNPPQATYMGTAIPMLFQSGLNCPYGPDAPTQDYLAVDFQFGSTASSTNYPFNMCFTGIVSYGIVQQPRYNFAATPLVTLRVSDYLMGSSMFRGNIAYADTLNVNWARYAYNGTTGPADPYRSTLSTSKQNGIFTILSRGAANGEATDIANSGLTNGSILGMNAMVGGATVTTGLTLRNVLNQTDQTTQAYVGAGLGTILYGNSSSVPTQAWLSGNITAAKQFLCQTGTGTVSAAPAWCPLTPATAGSAAIGTAALPWSGLYIGAAATNNIQITGTATAARTATLQDATGKLSLEAGYECGTTTTCTKTLQTNPIVHNGTVTLSSGAATVTTLTAYSSTSSMFITCTDTTSAAAVKCVAASTTSFTVAGTGTDVISYHVEGH